MDDQEGLVLHYVLYVWTLITAHTFIRKKLRKGERMKESYKEEKAERMAENG
jgi:hypothetical protein